MTSLIQSPVDRRRARRPGSISARGAFTLLELLVVIAIITLLMSILTPSLSRARQQAKSTVCMTRLSEFMKGLTAYAGDNDFRLPPLMWDTEDAPDSARHGWAEALYVYMYQDKDFPWDYDYPVQRNFEGRFALWVCKEAEPLVESSGHYRVYEYTWSRGSLDRIKHRLPIFMDANPLVTDEDDLRRPDIPMEHVAGLLGEAYIDERHYGGANYAFDDGHVERDTNLKEKLAEDWDLNPETENE